MHLIKPSILLAAALFLAFPAERAAADPWARSGDPVLRHDLRLLADAGLLRAPVNAWPIPWGTIAAELAAGRSMAELERQHDLVTLAALARVQARVSEVRSMRGLQPNARLAVRTDDFWLRNFEETPREEGELRVGASWMGDRVAFRAQASFVPDPAPGDREWRADGSYLAGILGNHIFYAGALDQWWGPGHADTLLLSSNARPVPGLGLQRNAARPAASRWLSWAGPWAYSVLWGFLESDRELPDGRLLAVRLGFRPLESLEIGLSRAAVWCGRGADCDGSALVDVVAASGDAEEQLSAVDFRWQLPAQASRFAVYGQAVAQDRSGGFSSRYFGQLGLETWGSVDTALFSGSWRAYLEYSNTLVQAWRSEPRYDQAYNLPVQASGFRHRGRALGAALDGDGEVLSAGVLLVDDAGRSWHALLRHGTLNKRGDGEGLDTSHSVAPEELKVSGIQLSHRRAISHGQLKLGTLSVGVGLKYADNRVTGQSDTDPQAFVQWTWDFSGL